MQAAVTIDLGHLPYNKCRLLWTKVLSTVWEGSPHTMCCPKMHYESNVVALMAVIVMGAAQAPVLVRCFD